MPWSPEVKPDQSPTLDQDGGIIEVIEVFYSGRLHTPVPVFVLLGPPLQLLRV